MKKILLTAFSLLGAFYAHALLDARFTLSYTPACNSLLATFTNVSVSSNPVSSSTFYWGDGTPATATTSSTISHLYSGAGTYCPYLVVVDNTGARDTSYGFPAAACITVNRPPTINLVFDRPRGCAPTTVCMRNLSTPGCGTLSGCSFDLGAGVVIDSCTSSPICINYPTAGNYTVIVRLQNSCGCVATATLRDTIRLVSPVSANFTATPTFSCVSPARVNFTNLSSGGGTLRYAWDLNGDGIYTDDSTANPSRIYPSGSYTVGLRVFNDYGCVDSIIRTSYINVSAPRSSFTFTSSTACGTATVTCTAASVPPASGYLWTVLPAGPSGSGNTFTFNPSTSGAYQVRLTSDYSGCSDDTVRTINVTVNPRPTASYTNTCLESCSAPFVVTYRSTSVGVTGTTSWVFPGGTPATATGVGPIAVTYNAMGTYLLPMLTVTTAAGCRDSIRLSGNVRIFPIDANFRADKSNGCRGTAITFADLSTANACDSIVSWSWRFGPGVGTATTRTAVFSFPDTGCFDVRLIVQSTRGCRDTINSTQIVCIGDTPTVRMVHNPDTMCFESQAVFFQALGTADSIWWSFGDGMHARGDTISHMYEDTGFFVPRADCFWRGCGPRTIYGDTIYILYPVSKFLDSTWCGNRLRRYFKDRSLGADSVFWDFGVTYRTTDTSSQRNPFYTYDSVGCYSVTQYTWNKATGCTHQVTQSVCICSPNLNFTINALDTCVNSRLRLINTSTCSRTSSNTQFFNGVTWSPLGSSSQLLVFPYTCYQTIRMVNISPEGCRDTITRPNYVRLRQVVARGGIPNRIGCVPFTCQFYDSTIYFCTSGTRFMWDFGDPSRTDDTSSLRNPVYTYRTPGRYVPFLRVYDSMGCFSALSLPAVNVYGSIASFTVSDSLKCSTTPLSVFPDVQYGTRPTYSWTIPTGIPSTSTSLNPGPITFNTAGDFTIVFRVNDTLGCYTIDSHRVSVYIPTADFTADDTSFVCDGNLVQFYDSSRSNICHRTWYFGDGQPPAVDLQNPQHLYNLPGRYDVTLIIETCDGCVDTTIKRSFINISGPSGTVTFAPSTICTNNSVRAYITTRNTAIINYLTGFGPLITINHPRGAIGDSTLYDTIDFVYPDTGVYRPQMLISDTSGCNIVITPTPATVTVDSIWVKFGWRRTRICDSATFCFYDSSIYLQRRTAATQWTWNFGDGSPTANTRNACHNYTAPGLYRVTLSAGSPGFCADTHSIFIFVPRSPDANYLRSDSFQCASEPAISFTDLSISDTTLVSWTWQFRPLSATSSLQNPSYDFLTAGTYNVNLIIRDTMGCVDSISKPIWIVPNIAGSAGIDTTICYGDSIRLQGSGGTGYVWSPTTGLSNSTVVNPWAKPLVTTNYVLQITDSAGCVSFDTVIVNVSTVVATFRVDTVCFGGVSRFFDISTSTIGSVNRWSWNFGDPPSGAANTSTLNNPTHVFTSATSFPVNLRATNARGCVDDTTMLVPVQVTPVANFAAVPVCYGDSMRFIDLSTVSVGSITQWGWNFGVTGTTTDTSNTSNPVFYYSSPGLYTVTLHVGNATCGKDTSLSVRVWPLPTARFRNDTTCVNSAAVFTDQSIDTFAINAWRWDFDTAFAGGDTSIIPSPTYTFTSAGNFMTRLRVTDIHSCSDDTVRRTTIVALPTASFAGDTLCPYDTMFFSDASLAAAGSISRRHWDFGTGRASDTSNLSNPRFIYTAAGTYVARLTVWDRFGCTDDTTISITIVPGPVPNFRADPVCYGDSSRFIDLSSVSVGSIILRGWNFGVSGTSTDTSNLTNPVYYYNAPGLYRVSLHVASAICARDTAISVRVWQLPVARFRVDTTCVNSPAVYTDQSTDTFTINSWRWNFDTLFAGGDTSLIPSPTYTFTSAGNYMTRLIVSDIHSCADDTVRRTTIVSLPIASFVGDTLCPFDTMAFTDATIAAAGSVSRRHWDFGTGRAVDTSNLANPRFAYTTPGTYIVHLTVWDRFGCTDDTSLTMVVVQGPVPNFSADTVCFRDSTHFFDSTTVAVGSIVVWRWDFGDGTFSAVPNPTHLYGTSGTRVVRLTVTSSNGCVASITKSILVYAPPVASFTADSACFRDTTHLISNSSGPNPFTSYTWLLTVSDSVSGVPATSWVYANTGANRVTLRIIDSKGCKDDTTRNVFVYTLPVANFTNSPLCNGFPVSFTNTSINGSGIINRWNWDFDEVPPVTSNIASPVHTFNDTLTHDIVLIVTDNHGCHDDTIRTIRIFANPDARFNVTPSLAVCLGQPLCFHDSSQSAVAPINRYEWDMTGDLIPEFTNVTNPCYTYPSSGNYSVTLRITDTNMCYDTARIRVTVNQPPVADFDWDTTCQNSPVNFIDRSRAGSGIINNWSWNFGDLSGDNVQNPTHTYPAFGFYTVSLVVTDANGCTDADTQTVVIDSIPTVIAYADTSVCLGNSVILHASGAATYIWTPATGLNRNDSAYVVATPPSSLAYTVTGYSWFRACPPSSQQIVVQVLPPMPFDVTGRPTTIVLGSNSQLEGFPAGRIDSIRWSPDFTLNCSDCIDPVATPDQTTTYYARIYYSLIDAYCWTDDSVTINVLNQCPKEMVFIPNTFTPNQDGQNDAFYVRGYGLEEVKIIRIFDRWGNILFERYNVPANDANNAWYGKDLKETRDMNPGVYVYYVEVYCSNRDLIKISGNVTLVR